MAYRMRWLPAHCLLLGRYEGEIGLEDLRAGVEEQIEAGVSGPGLRQLNDHRASDLLLSPDEVREFVDWLRARGVLDQRRDARTASLASGPRATALTLLFAHFAGIESRWEIFASVEAAARWLDIEPALLEQHRDVIPHEG